MNIAFIRDEYDPFGGAERFTQAVAAGLVQKGNQVHILARKWKESSASGVRFIRIKAPGAPSVLRQFLFVRRAGRAVARHGFDLVQSNERALCQHVFRAGDGVHAQWLENRGRFLGKFSRLSAAVNPFHWYMLHLERRMFSDPRLLAVIVNSEMVKKEIAGRFHFPENRLHLIYNGVDPDRFRPDLRRREKGELRVASGVPAGSPLALFLGSGFRRKGLGPLIRAVGACEQKPFLWVVGKGGQKPYQRLARRLGIGGRVFFWGPKKEAHRFYQEADFFVLPTVYDPFPSVVLEAMACGLPVITTAQCGGAEIITRGKNGFVIPRPDDVKTMARHMGVLCRVETASAMSVSARQTARRFSMDKTIERTLALYETLMASKQ